MATFTNLDKFANNLVNNQDKFKKLANIAGKRDYPGKVKRLREKISSEVELWNRKGSSPKLEDLKKDLNFVDSVLDYSEIDKEKIDLLATKYSIGYGEINRKNY